jgi:hypothetical protein
MSTLSMPTERQSTHNPRDISLAAARSEKAEDWLRLGCEMFPALSFS